RARPHSAATMASHVSKVHSTKRKARERCCSASLAWLGLRRLLPSKCHSFALRINNVSRRKAHQGITKARESPASQFFQTADSTETKRERRSQELLSILPVLRAQGDNKNTAQPPRKRQS